MYSYDFKNGLILVYKTKNNLSKKVMIASAFPSVKSSAKENNLTFLMQNEKTSAVDLWCSSFLYHGSHRNAQEYSDNVCASVTRNFFDGGLFLSRYGFLFPFFFPQDDSSSWMRYNFTKSLTQMCGISPHLKKGGNPGCILPQTVTLFWLCQLWCLTMKQGHVHLKNSSTLNSETIGL